MKSRIVLRIVAGLALVLGLTAGVRATLTQLHGTAREIPTARVRRGDLDIKVYSSGELRPSRSVNMMAPPVSGSLQIIHLATTGAHLKAGDSVVEFDTSEQEYKLEQARSQFDEADQQITKSKADTAVTEAEDKVNLLKARFDVRRAELDVSRNELLSRGLPNLHHALEVLARRVVEQVQIPDHAVLVVQSKVILEPCLFETRVHVAEC